MKTPRGKPRRIFIARLYFLFIRSLTPGQAPRNALAVQFTTMLAACIFPLIVPVIHAQSERIILVNRSLRPEYDQTVETLVSTLKTKLPSYQVELVDFNPPAEGTPEFWSAVSSRKPKLVITVGNSATMSAMENLSGVPIVFTMVVDNILELANKEKDKDIVGVSLAISPERQLKLISETLPQSRRIGLLYSDSHREFAEKARNYAQKLGLRLVASEVTTERDIFTVLENSLSEIDMFWMPPDELIYERNNLRFILLKCFKSSVPIMAMFKHVAQAGTPFAIGFNYEDIGEQTAELTIRKIKGQVPKNERIEQPRKIVLYVNDRLVESLGLKLPDEVAETAISIQASGQ